MPARKAALLTETDATAGSDHPADSGTDASRARKTYAPGKAARSMRSVTTVDHGWELPCSCMTTLAVLGMSSDMKGWPSAMAVIIHVRTGLRCAPSKMTMPHAAVVLPSDVTLALELLQLAVISNPTFSGSLRMTTGARPRVACPTLPPSVMVVSMGSTIAPPAASYEMVPFMRGGTETLRGSVMAYGMGTSTTKSLRSDALEKV